MKRIALIGATGAIGTALLDKCIKYNTEAYVFIRPDSKRKDRVAKAPGIHCISCGMKDMLTVDVSNIPPIDAFYFFSWEGTYGTDARNDLEVQIANIRYAVDAVQLAAKLQCRTYIGAGTQAEYGRVEGMLKPDTPCRPENGYGMAKLCAGQMSRIACEKLGIRHIWGRIVSTYGPRDGEWSVVSCAIRDCISAKTPQFTKGEQVWDYLYSEDAAEAFYRMGKSGKDGAVYVVGSGKTRKLREFMEVICKTANPQVEPVFGAVPYMDRQVMHLQADISDLTADTGFVPEIGFEDGIQKTVEWMRRNSVRG